ncbi:hypothetical protein [Paenibacillus segetis]|uniref:Uncharacterized protein n=1 Tax=Paenibacillus segetis TaxID=1325360 RepID=A0ABQ1YAT5_9BACL|nr:hypothetical protein [Paenibacillus segetis]GGH19180.1 hypothetical protein GCM10008013_15680 [Paenibacillus segetis]
MRKKIWLSLLLAISLVITFYVGYIIGDKSNGLLTPNAANKAIQSRWVNEKEPPLPQILIEGVNINVYRSSYSWCTPSSGKNSDTSCVAVDASIPEITPTIVPAGSMIETLAPNGIKQFTLSNRTEGFDGDPYIVPTNKGIYLYHIHCEWFLDQGQSDYYFSIEVA